MLFCSAPRELTAIFQALQPALSATPANFLPIPLPAIPVRARLAAPVATVASARQALLPAPEARTVA